MGLPSKFSTAILFCLAFTVVHIYGELVMLKYPKGNHTTERNYTCITEDDGASIIWYLGRSIMSENWSELEDSTPATPEWGNVRDCAIRGESKCLAKWVRTSDWRVVNSAAKPTGPVFDYRFRDLRLFESWDDPGDNRYGSYDAPRYGSEESSRLDGTPSPRPYDEGPESQSSIDFENEWWDSTKVGEVNKSSSTVWFSGRKLEWGDFGVLLCEQYGSCVWVKIFRFRIEVRSCPSGASSLGDELRVSKCDSPSEVVDRDIWSVGRSMWVQYRLEWDTRQETIKIFRGNDSVPLVQGTMPSWDTVSAVGFTMRYIGPRVRFHFFDYYFTDTKNSVISTRSIPHHGEMFCAELLVGLCPKCKLNVTLVNLYGAGIETWSFSGDEHDPYNGLLRWQLVKLNTRFDTDIPRILSLKMETILEGDVGAGEWAIDNFRIPVSCQPEGKLKESRRTLSIRVSPTCQKLSLADNFVVEFNVHGMDKDSEVLSELSKFLRHQTGPLVGKGGSIIRRNGRYICDRGFTGFDCNDECNPGFYGFECTQRCGFCRNFPSCNKSTGFCDTDGCSDSMIIKPFCKTVFVAPSAEDVKDTTATILQSVELSEDEVLDKIEVQIREAGSDQTWTNFIPKLRNPGSSVAIYEAQITGLKPSTVFTVRTAVSVERTLTFSPEYNFTTRLGTHTDNEKHTTPEIKPNSTGESPSSPAAHHRDQTEAPTVVNVTASSAKIIQNVKPAGYDGQIFVIFVLREVWSNASVALLPTNTAALSYELDVKNLKPYSLYKVYALVTVLESDRAVTQDSSPIIFNTKCPDAPNFEVTPSEGGITVDILSRPEDCDYPANREYTVEAHDTEDHASGLRRVGYGFATSSYTTVRRFPVAMGLSPDTEYEVKISIERWKNRRLVFTTKIRTSAAEEASYEDY